MVRDRRTIRDKPKVRPRSGVRYDTAPFRLNDDPGKLGDPFRGWTGDPYGRELDTRNKFISDSKYVAPEYWDADEYHKKREAEERKKREDIKKEATVKEPPNRDEPKGGKKPRGKGGAGRGFGGPNSGDEVDDDKGRRPGDSSDDDSDDDSDNGNGGNGNIGCTIKANEKYSVEEFDRQMGSGGCCNPPPSGSSITFFSHMDWRWGETPQPTGSERFFYTQGQWESEWAYGDPDLMFESIGVFCDWWMECTEFDYVIPRFSASTKDIPQCIEGEEPENIRTITIPDMNEECCGMIRRIYEFLDPESFPAEMPEKITVNADNPENRIKRINTLPEWLMYRFDIDDERWGEFEVKVEIDDVNLMTKEQEHAEIKLPNLAESIAEIFGLVMEIAISHQVTQNAVLTCLHEAGLAHAAAFKAGREVSEILDYLGFETEEKYEKLKTAFTPEADNFEELLEPNESKVKITNQKNAKETLETALNQIKEIFSIVRAQGTLQVNGNDPSKDILADLTRLYDSMKKQDEIREQETNKVKELLKKDFPDIKIETELIDGDNPLRETL
ncbi:hypothetical protein [Limnospira platensis]|uniref:hypothetical protein n=1 Tax=Limnospira platensis TaxID=118562 RepID=UPI0001D0EB8E|nr:hypothetical protein [Arthrospira platensis NCB002]BAI88344.1 hypothetical protein NIES39_A05060 [Arthrospira platensis NIES-39]BDT10760.1 hypothetical protein N39L_04830 [Arthrospira platensis NIES-39]